jgi:precorrin-2/cobalt-factor-2 C20-methyltransferase
VAGLLYGVGVGPGDPELLTLRAARIIREAPVIAVPVTQADGDSYALGVVAPLITPEQRVLSLHFPMVKDTAARRAYRQAAAAAIASELDAGYDVAFLTEGDPLLHSTFIYVLEHLPAGTALEIVPGVTSIAAATAQAALPLVSGNQRLAVLPATFENVDELRGILGAFDTVVLLKFARVFDRLLDLLCELHLDRTSVVVERASHPAGRVVRDLEGLRGRPIHYLSLLIVQGGRERAGEVRA